MNRKKKRRIRRTIVGYKQYLILKKIDELEKEGKPVYFSLLASELRGKVVWGYIVAVVRDFERRGLIDTESVGRLRIIHMTDRGREALRLIERLIDIMGFNPEE